MAWGDTDTVQGVGGSPTWTTLAAFEADHDGDTITNGNNTTALITGVPADTGTVFWAGFQSGMNSTTRLVVTFDPGNTTNTDGTNGTGNKAVIEDLQNLVEGTNAFHLDIIGVEFNGVSIFLAADGDGELRVAKCFFRDLSGNSGINVNGLTADYTLKVGGCLFRDVSDSGSHAGILINDATVVTQIEVFNCTLISGIRGIWEFTSDVKAINVACADNSTADFLSITTPSFNASKDATASGTGSITTLTTTDADDFTAPSTGDFTVFDNASVLYEAGEARAESWFTTLCPTDLNGVTWRATPAIGCYELFVAVGVKLRTLSLLGAGI